MTTNTLSNKASAHHMHDQSKGHVLVWMKLGRVSNLPTVWTNGLTGLALASTAGVNLNPYTVLFSLIAVTLAYIAGMFLNDVFDANFDKAHKLNRPIANGEIETRTVAVAALALLVWCVTATLLAASLSNKPVGQALFAVSALIGSIVMYNAWHKNNPFSPVIMGTCRALVYITCALIIANSLTLTVVMAAAMLGLYVMGLTYSAKQEHLNEIKRTWPLIGLTIPLGWATYIALQQPLAGIPLALLYASIGYALHRILRRAPGDVPVAVVTLIAGIALWDAVLLFANGFPALAITAMVCWILTLRLQRRVSGT